MSDLSTLIFGVLFGAVGLGYVVYGRKQRMGMALLSGVVLCIFPYFVSNIVLVILIGVIFMALPFFLRF